MASCAHRRENFLSHRGIASRCVTRRAAQYQRQKRIRAAAAGVTCIAATQLANADDAVVSVY